MSFVLDDDQMWMLKEKLQNNTKIGFIGWRKGQQRVDKISLLLKRNNMRYGAYPSDSVCAHIAHDVYETRKHEDRAGGQIPGGWSIEQVFNDLEKTSYYAAIYHI